MKNKFGIRLKEQLKENHLSQKDFAKKIGASESIVSDWIKQKSVPSVEYLFVISEYFNVCSDYLIGRQDWF